MRVIFRPTLPIAALIAAATALVAVHASAQNAPSASPPRAEKPATPTATPPAAPPVRRPRDDSDSAQAIEDDPTVETGGEQESADSNLSFPVDI